MSASSNFLECMPHQVMQNCLCEYLQLSDSVKEIYVMATLYHCHSEVILLSTGTQDRQVWQKHRYFPKTITARHGRLLAPNLVGKLNWANVSLLSILYFNPLFHNDAWKTYSTNKYFLSGSKPPTLNISVHDHNPKVKETGCVKLWGTTNEKIWSFQTSRGWLDQQKTGMDGGIQQQGAKILDIILTWFYVINTST